MCFIMCVDCFKCVLLCVDCFKCVYCVWTVLNVFHYVCGLF